MTIKPIRIAIWGTGRAGKTTYIASLYHDYLGKHQDWDIQAGDEVSQKFIQEMRATLFEYSRFPEKTVTTHEYRYTVFDKHTQDSFELNFFDTAGEQFENYIFRERRDHPVSVEQSTTEALASDWTPQKVFEQMLTCDGLIVLIDPAWKDRQSKGREIHSLLYTYFDDLRTARRERNLKEPVIALCLSKVDGKDHTWHKREGVGGQENCFRRTHESPDICAQLCPVYDYLEHKFMSEHLPGVLSQENIACFAISAIGRKDNHLNIGVSSPWERTITPPPNYDFKNKSDLIDYEIEIHNVHVNETYEPTSISNANDIKSFNLHKPIEWIRTQVYKE